MTFAIENRHRIKVSRVTKLWARVWRLAVLEAKRKEDCRCDVSLKCKCKKASDYRLSMMFQPPGREGYSPTERLRIFESIAANGSLPADGSHPKREGFDIVKEVAKRPGYGWTKDVFESPLWYLLRNPEMDAEELSEFIVHCLLKVFPKYEYVSRMDQSTAKDLGIVDAEDLFMVQDPLLSLAYDKKFPFKLDDFNLDYLALIGALFKDAYLAGALHLAVHLEKVFLNTIEGVGFSLPWMDDETQQEFGNVCKESVLRSHVMIPFENYPNLIETYREKAHGRIKHSELRFIQHHRDRIQNDFLKSGLPHDKKSRNKRRIFYRLARLHLLL